MRTERDFSAFIGTVYDTILQPGLWPDILERFCERLGAEAASVHIVDPVRGKASMFVEHGTDPAWTALLLTRYASMSPIGAAVLMADLDEPVGAFDFVDEQEFVASRFYREWCEPQGYHDMLGALIAKRTTEVGAISATRLRAAGRFGEEDRAFVGLVAPHVRRAVSISGLLERQTVERSQLSSVIDQLRTAMVMIDAGRRIVRTNASAEQLFAEGAVANGRGGLLALVDGEAQAALVQGLAATAPAPLLIATRGSDGRAYLAALIPAEAGSGQFAFLIDRHDEDIAPLGKHLAALFHLTPREVSVLMPLLEGRAIDEVAATLGIAEDTARSHLKRLLFKTGTNRQQDLIQRVMQALPPIRVPPSA